MTRVTPRTHSARLVCQRQRQYRGCHWHCLDDLTRLKDERGMSSHRNTVAARLSVGQTTRIQIIYWVGARAQWRRQCGGVVAPSRAKHACPFDSTHSFVLGD